MKRAMILLPVGLILANCGSSGSYGVHLDPLPASVAAPCPEPWEVPPGGTWKVYAARLGSALLVCGDEKDLAVEGYNEAARIVGPK